MGNLDHKKEDPFLRHSGGGRNPVPLFAGFDIFWTPDFAGVTTWSRGITRESTHLTEGRG